MDAPPLLAGGAESVALRDGGVLKLLTSDSSFKGEAEFNVSPLEGEFKDGWFTLHSTFAWFKVGPNKLLAIGGTEHGTLVFPVTVERVPVSPARTNLTGCVRDEAGVPIRGAKVELGPKRYVADSWMEAEDLDVWKAGRALVGPPALSYRSISEEHGNPIATTDAQGRFEFESVQRVEYVLTVEADGFAPQWRLVNAGREPPTDSHQFRLKTGAAVRGRVVDQDGKPVGGACVVFGRWHVHAEPDGYFHWAIDAPVPKEVLVQARKRYNGDYLEFEERRSLARIRSRPIELQRAK